MKIKDSIVFISGANRGLGKVCAERILAAGAARVYAAARQIESIRDSRMVPVELDITNPAEVAAATAACGDVSILINNAGSMRLGTFLEENAIDRARTEMETNYLGTLSMCRAFAPVLAKNGGGALVNMLSVVSWYTFPFNSAYCASKAAEWQMTNGLRIELRRQGTLVTGVHAGFIDTDMAAGVDAPKTSAEDVAARIIEGIESDAEEVLADAYSREIKARLANDSDGVYRELQSLWDRLHEGFARDRKLGLQGERS